MWLKTLSMAAPEALEGIDYMYRYAQYYMYFYLHRSFMGPKTKTWCWFWVLVVWPFTQQVNSSPVKDTSKELNWLPRRGELIHTCNLLLECETFVNYKDRTTIINQSNILLPSLDQWITWSPWMPLLELEHNRYSRSPSDSVPVWWLYRYMCLQ